MSSLSERLIAEPVNAVCFVMDYVELHFNGPILRCLAPPVVRLRDVQIEFPQPGSRDALCALIGQVPEQVLIREAQSIEVRFASGHSLVVPLDHAKTQRWEAAHFVPEVGQPMEVW